MFLGRVAGDAIYDVFFDGEVEGVCGLFVRVRREWMGYERVKWDGWNGRRLSDVPEGSLSNMTLSKNLVW